MVLDVWIETGARGAREGAGAGGSFGFWALNDEGWAGGRLLLEREVFTTTRSGALDVLVLFVVDIIVAFCCAVAPNCMLVLNFDELASMLLCWFSWFWFDDVVEAENMVFDN